MLIHVIVCKKARFPSHKSDKKLERSNFRVYNCMFYIKTTSRNIDENVFVRVLKYLLFYISQCSLLPKTQHKYIHMLFKEISSPHNLVPNLQKLEILLWFLKSFSEDCNSREISM